MTQQLSANAALVERFSKALYELADAEKGTDTIAQELIQIKIAANQNPDLKKVLTSPVLKRLDQKKSMSALLQNFGASQLMQKFIGVLAEKRRLYLIESIAGRFQEMLNERRGLVTAYVTSARELSPDQMALLQKNISDRMGGQKIQLDIKINPEILGGLVVRVGSVQIDDSLKTKLNNMAMALKA